MEARITEKDVGVKSRSVLWYLTFFGFAINYILRINASITIVGRWLSIVDSWSCLLKIYVSDMIDLNYRKSSSNKTIVTSECIVIDTNLSSISPELSNEFNLAETEKYVSLERRFLDFLGVSRD